MFRRSSYVGVTATPFANIFIDPASTHDMLGDDLFPRDLIHVFESPTNYLGMNALFGGADPETPDPAEADLASTVLRTIHDEEEWLPATHKKDADFHGLPDTLRRALRCFLLATAVRDLHAAGEEADPKRVE